MKLYAFQNKKNKNLVTGTDFSMYPHRQIFSEYSRPVFLTEKEVYKMNYALENELAHRMINLDNYDLVECEVTVTRRVGKKEIDKIIKGERNDTHSKR